MQYHLVAFLTIAIWGSTFISTKILIYSGLSPLQIFVIRFLIAYLLLLAFHHRKIFADSLCDEFRMILIGVFGGSAYFLTENGALEHTTATNVSLIVCSCPLFAMLALHAFSRSEHFSPRQYLGSVVALLGMAVVVLNGHFVLHLSPYGDALAFGACISWAVYSIVMKGITDRYSPVFLTRKTFFYGLITALPFFCFDRSLPSFSVMFETRVWGNLLFLSVIASLLCFLSWNWCLEKMGVVKCTNWVYFNPITTILFAWLVLDETITIYFILGAVLILAGMYFTNKHL